MLCDGQIREVEASGRGRPDRGRTTSRSSAARPASLIATSCRLGGHALRRRRRSTSSCSRTFGDVPRAWPSSCPTTSWTSPSSQLELGKEPGTDLREGVYTAAGAARPAAEAPDRDELRRPARDTGRPTGELLDRALEIVRTGGVDRARPRPRWPRRSGARSAWRAQLPDGPARHALVQLAKFLAVRCGAEVGAA